MFLGDPNASRGGHGPGRPMRCRPWDFDGPIGSKEPSFCWVSALLKWRPQEPTWSGAPPEARYSGKHLSPVFQQPVHFSETSKSSYMSFGRGFIFIQGNMHVSFSSSLLFSKSQPLSYKCSSLRSRNKLGFWFFSSKLGIPFIKLIRYVGFDCENLSLTSSTIFSLSLFPSYEFL